MADFGFYGKKGWLVALLAGLCAACAIPHAAGQVSVDVQFKRSLYLKYEPILATVTIENMTGRELYLSDSDGKAWFGFEIMSRSNQLMPPRDPNYQLEPVQLGPGQKLTRRMNLTPLYAIEEYGAYEVRAIVYLAEERRYCASAPKHIDVTEGRLLGQQTVGIPDGEPDAGATRVVSLLSLRLSRSTMLYLRIADPISGTIYATHQLGKFVMFGSPKMELDVKNNVHVLQNAAPKEFIYTKVDLDGKVLERKVYSETTTQPALRKQGGAIVVAGGAYQQPAAQASPGASPGGSPSTPTLSDRPVPLPKD